MQAKVYKISTPDQWAEALRAGRFVGSPDDQRDGFIHLSTAGQLAGTLARHFKGKGELVLAAFDARQLGAALKWEPARDGALFPHLYAELDPSLALRVEPIATGPDGRHVLPEGLD